MNSVMTTSGMDTSRKNEKACGHDGEDHDRGSHEHSDMAPAYAQNRRRGRAETQGRDRDEQSPRRGFDQGCPDRRIDRHEAGNKRYGAVEQTKCQKRESENRD